MASEVRGIRCADCPVRRKALFRPFSEAELAFVEAMKTAQLAVPPREHVVEAGQVGVPLMTLFEGWALRYRRGIAGKRHILAILLPGDLIAPETALLGRVEHSVIAITPVTLCFLEGRSLVQLFGEQPQLALSLYRNQLEEIRWYDIERVNGNTGNALARLGFIFLHTFDRLKELGLANGTACPFPLKRSDLADRAGLSTMHLNRTLGTLKRQRLATLIDSTLHIPNRARLAKLVHYAPRREAGQRAIL